MSSLCQILVSRALARLVVAIGVAGGLNACGQRGPLYLPTDAAAANRATLSDIIRPGALSTPAAAASAPSTTGTANPVRMP